MDKFDRIQQLHRILNARRYPISPRDLADQLECTEKTIERNLKYMQDVLTLPLIRMPRQGWIYENNEQGVELPGTWLTYDELLALSSLLNVVSNLDSEFIENELKPIHQHLDKILKGRGISPRKFNQKIKIIPLLKQVSDHNTFNKISTALVNETRLNLHYLDYKGQTTNRQISPQRLIHYQENWFIDSYCHLRKDLRTFKLSRIKSADSDNKKIKKVPQKQLDSYFSSSYGLFSGASKHTAKLRFTGDVAREVALQQWHPEQQAQWDGNDYLLNIPYNKDQELIRDILKYANNVEVLSPAVLRKKIINIHNASLHLYTGVRTRI